MFQYLSNSIIDAIGQLMTIFGWTFVLSLALYMTSMGLRSIGSKWLGMKYYYLVSPGVACHEVGHAIGCLLTNKKILEFVPFRPDSKGTLGYVNHLTTNTLAGRAGEFIVATGPVWFGSFVILLLTRLLVGQEIFMALKSTVNQGFGLSDYLLSVFAQAFDLAMRLVTVWEWRSPLDLVLTYLIVCVASEVTLSGPDLRGMWIGMIAIITMFIFGNMVPVIDYWFAQGVEHVKPVMFVVHVTLAFVLLLDFFVFVLAFGIDKIMDGFNQKKEE